MTLHVRSTAAAPALLARFRSTVQSLDPNLPLLSTRMLRDQTRLALTVFSMAASVLTVFGVIAVILTALGTFGLVSYTARQSTHEIGIRIAIGANRGGLLSAIPRTWPAAGRRGRGVRPCAVVADCADPGEPCSTASARRTSSRSARALALVITIVLMASLIPAWRASRTDPIAALRHR